jgi:hypothetical protein
VTNGTETDTDCGGANCKKCDIAQKCVEGDDCTTGLCAQGVCAQTCSNGVQDGTETGIDCGGATCPRCPDGN